MLAGKLLSESWALILITEMNRHLFIAGHRIWPFCSGACGISVQILPLEFYLQLRKVFCFQTCSKIKIKQNTGTLYVADFLCHLFRTKLHKIGMLFCSYKMSVRK